MKAMVLDGYIRVSQIGGRAGASFISPKVQREQIEGWTGTHGTSLGMIFEELGESGGRSDRPLLLEAIERVENGESNGIVVAKLDRFGRSVLDGLRAMQRIEGAGGTFVSVQDGFDLSTPTGKLVLKVLFSISEWELERVRANWDIAKSRAIARGVYVAQVPIGYKRGADGRLRPNPPQSEGVRQIFGRRTRGESFHEIAKALNAQGRRTDKGLPFSYDTVAGIIRNRAYRGEAHNGPHSNPDAHEALVDGATWQQAQYRPYTPQKRSQSLLSGMIRCASCGQMMSATHIEGQKARYNAYRCNEDHRQRCRAPAYARGDELDPLVEEFIFRECRKPRQSDGELELERREIAAAEAEAELAAYRDEPLMLSVLGAIPFAEGLASRRRILEERLLDLGKARSVCERAPSFDLTALEKRWARLSWPERRREVRKVVDGVVVERGQRSLTKRVWIYRRDRGPIIKTGGKLVTPFDPASGDSERLKAHQRWPLLRLERELRKFLEQRKEWPLYLDFAKEGRARLHAQVMCWGGPYYWGPRLDVRVPKGTVRWTEAAIAGALGPFLEGREHWPATEEFMEGGLAPLYHAIRRGSGVACWAERFGLLYKDRWPEERIEAKLREFTSGRSVFPGREEFRAAGEGALYNAMHRRQGSRYWAQRLDLASRPSWQGHKVA
jgi:DNA invertase Pin-like site-specific DNA recombinase